GGARWCTRRRTRRARRRATRRASSCSTGRRALHPRVRATAASPTRSDSAARNPPAALDEASGGTRRSSCGLLGQGPRASRASECSTTSRTGYATRLSARLCELRLRVRDRERRVGRDHGHRAFPLGIAHPHPDQTLRLSSAAIRALALVLGEIEEELVT